MPLSHISDLYKLTENGSGRWLNRKVFSLILLAGLALSISASAPEHSINIAMHGYSVHERTDFIMDYWPVFDELASVIKGLFPGAELPDTPLHMLFGLETLDTSTHTLLPGVIMGNRSGLSSITRM